MVTPSNLYAEKVYSEHPLVLWALDEEIPAAGSADLDSVSTKSNIKNVNAFKYNSLTRAYAYSNANQSASTNGYYIYETVSGTTQAYVENGGTPIVYGASNVTEMYPHRVANQPSIIIPGMGFMNESGKYNNYTFEFWLRTIAGAKNPLRIFGPVASDDGLYIYEQSMILKVGQYFVSYFVGEFQRPLFIQIQLGQDGAKLLSNGEVVGEIAFDAKNITFPDIMSPDNKEQDWLGFYAYSPGANGYIKNIELDCIAIYPTLTPLAVAKKRFAYGQAVEFPQDILSKYGSSTFSADYSVANYVKNYNYPTTQQFSSGQSYNLKTLNSSVSAPDLKLPGFYFYKNGNLVDKSLLLQDQPIAGQISFSPTEDYSGGYIKFDSIPTLSKTFSAFYGIIKLGLLNDMDGNSQTFVKIVDKITGNYLHVMGQKTSTDILTLKYDLYVNGSGSGVHQEDITITDYANVAFGLDILNNMYTLNTFLVNSQNNLVVYVGGDESNQTAFRTNLVSFGFIEDEARKLNRSDLFNNDGTLYANIALGYKIYPSYALVFKTLGSLKYPDISAAGYWIDYVPNTALSKISSNDEYRYDFVQFNSNIDQGSQSLSVGRLVDAGTAVIHSVATGDVTTLSENWFSRYGITPQESSSRAITLSRSRVINGSVIYPNVSWSRDQDVFKSRGILLATQISYDGIFTNPIILKSIQLASQIEDASTTIGSRHGAEFKPYRASNQTNPYVIYKGSTPQNYLTDKSGIRLVGAFNSQYTRGLSIKPNANNVDDFYISSMQFFINYTEEQFLSQPIAIFEVKSQTSGYQHLRFFLTKNPSDANEAFISCINVDTSAEVTLRYFINGHEIASPYIELKEWSSVGVVFPKPLKLYSTDSINIIGPGLFNNFSYFKIDQEKIATKTVYASWQSIKDAGDWQTQKTNGIWEITAYDQIDNVYSINPIDVYNMYFGTNKVIVESNDAGLLFSGHSYSIYKNTAWQSQIIKPV